MCQVVIVAGPDKGRSFNLLEGQTLLIGRGQASDTQINDPSMSRVHCQIGLERGNATISDAGSAGGTMVNGQPIQRQELVNGDLIEIGETQLRFQAARVNLESRRERVAGGNLSKRKRILPINSLVGQSLSQYRLDEIIAKGNSGIVFKAYDCLEERVTAVKVLTPDPAGSEEQKDRFVRAMLTFLPVKHPHIVQLYHAGKAGHYCWAAMEYVEGESVTQVISRIGMNGVLDWREAYRVAVHIGRALAEAHERRIIHRAITPANILRRQSDRVCLLGDFMLAKALDGTLARRVTQQGQLIGDVAYMPPEQTREGAEVDHRSDMYALGATLYALLTGRPPFEGSSLPVLIRRVRHEPPLLPKQIQRSVNDRFVACVLKLLEKRPEDRFPTPSSLLRELGLIGTLQNIDAD